jgi:hypothetical protein
MSADAGKPNYARQCKTLAAAKKNIPELAEPHTHVLQQALRTLEASFVAMWERGHGFPRFKKPGRMRSFLFPQMGVNPIQGNRLKLPKIGTVRLKHKRKGSNSWRKLQGKVARLHEHISNTRKDFHFKLAHRLRDSAGMIFAEDLNLKALAQGMLCKHTLDARWGGFLNILKWVAQKRGVYFALVDSSGTSQTCPQCQTHTGKKELSLRVHSCPNCGYQSDRDVAAAQVVMQRGIVSQCGLGVSPSRATGVAVGHTVSKLSEGKVVGLPVKKESPGFNSCDVARIV